MKITNPSTGNALVDSLRVDVNDDPAKIARWFRMRALPFDTKIHRIQFRAELDDDLEYITPVMMNDMVMSRSQWLKLSTEIDAFYAAHDSAAIFERNAAVALEAVAKAHTLVGKRTWLEGYNKLVYVAETTEPPVIHKIGVTSFRHLHSRMKALSCVANRPVRLIRWFDAYRTTARYAESKLHALFNDRHVIGEWFELTDADIAWVKANLPEIPAGLKWTLLDLEEWR